MEFLKEGEERYSILQNNMSLPFLVLALCCAVLSHSIMSDSLPPLGLEPTRLLCPWGFSRQEYWSGLPCLPPGDLPNPGIEPRAPTLQARKQEQIPTLEHVHIYIHTHTCTPPDPTCAGSTRLNGMIEFALLAGPLIQTEHRSWIKEHPGTSLAVQWLRPHLPK